MGYDKHRRYTYARRKVEDLATVLDVGGGTGDFLRRYGISGVVVEMMDDVALFRGKRIHESFVRYDGGSLPFAASSFEGVVCMDTLEHVPGPLRPRFLAELRRVASRKVVLTCPADRQHCFKAMMAIAKWFRMIGYSETMERSLQEHAARGLPSSTFVIEDFRRAGWSVEDELVFGRTSALFLLAQHLFPPLALEISNVKLDSLVQRCDRGPPSYLFITASRPRDSS